ncbi:Transport of quorum-sensing signal protein [Limihaloglobus sulfuriphilus]|uniref:Transport of quorum-sensing signal protein n=1 Tax=Limihaloglobus sulfuriphilus TaxID=1851148 RepID=A0A1Q2MGH1_9BACT|nr:AI-2E family transporter [Limihaloglobus sulfuriphilus]AQQ71780.1 Transport of quorum-sensing signal protein [Limihaloglobus sulfuriphilus]
MSDKNKNTAETEKMKAREAAARLRLEQNWISTAAVAILAAVAIGFTLEYAKTVLIPFVLALFIKQMVKPLIDWQMYRLRMVRFAAVLLTLVIVLLIFTGLCFFFASTVSTIAGKAADYGDKFVQMLEMLTEKLENSGFGIQKEQVSDEVLQQLKNKIPSFISTSFGTLMGFVTNSFLVAIFLMFLLAGYNPDKIPEGIYADISNQISKYLSIKFAVSFVTGILVWAILTICNLELASFFGILVFILNFIPNLGSIIATFLPLPIALAQYENPLMMAVVVLIPGAIQITIGNIVEPKLMGKGLSLHPVTILLALSFWGLLWGIIGMLLAAPITAIIRIVIMRFETLRPLGLLMAGQFPDMDESMPMNNSEKQKNEES